MIPNWGFQIRISEYPQHFLLSDESLFVGNSAPFSAGPLIFRRLQIIPQLREWLLVDYLFLFRYGN